MKYDSKVIKPKAKIFIFCGHEYSDKERKFSFKYRIEFFNREPLQFTEGIILPKDAPLPNPQNINIFLDPLELILGISYYKLYLPPDIKTSFELSREQAEFWNIVYRKGLGEFIYKNNLSAKNIAKFKYSKVETGPVRVITTDRDLLGIGGGKDSIVAADLLEQHKFSSFIVETQRPDPLSGKIAEKIGRPIIKIRRVLDPKIFEVHEGSYNGHIPISAVFAFLGLFTAAIYRYKHVIVANEHSSNFGNVVYKGETINHQWSKSAEFESLLQDYTRKFISPDIQYFSVLRQFYEIRIAKMFSRDEKYFTLFSSCNKNFNIYKDRPGSLWCGKCAKCAYVFLILSPFLSKKSLLKIFHRNLLDQKSLISLYRDILGFGNMKPFDCVGTFEEAQAALYLASNKYKKEIIVKQFLPKIQNPKKIIQKVFKTNQAFTLPTPYRFLGIKNVCVLGYAREGVVNEKYIRRNFPDLKIDILDQNRSNSYLNQQPKYDLAIKTPGIPNEKVTIPYVTATNLFFSQIRQMTIGVTGSKGKSTTASLIYEILKKGGKKVRLVGNIGTPMLEVLLGKVGADDIFVIELSSYMLSDIEYSPNIALLLNLFPEHMNYHGGIESYYAAKRNIFKFQKPGDVAIEAPFTEVPPLQMNETRLLGEHNFENIKAAVKVARILNVPDSVIREAIMNFKPLPHRLEFVGNFGGIKFYDDAISTTPQSTIMAIKTLQNIGTIFLGGLDRGYDFSELESVLRDYKIPNVVLFPDSGKRILKSRRGFNILQTKSMEEAVDFAYRQTPIGSICLLSTASPSYSLWKDFEEKGDLFKVLVENYNKNN